VLVPFPFPFSLLAQMCATAAYLKKKKKNEGAQEGFGETGVPCLAIHHCFYLGFFSATEEAAIEVPASKVLSCC